MKSYVLFTIAILVICSIGYCTDKSDYPMLAMQFNSSITPTLNNGIVITGISAIDSLNCTYHANKFEFQDILSSQFIRNILLLSFDKTNMSNIEAILPVYLTAGAPYCNYIEIIKEPEMLELPKEYLYAATMYHPNDILGEIQQAQSNNYWRFYSIFGTNNSLQNQAYYDEISLFVPGMSYQDIGIQNHPLFPWRFQIHGHLGLWHLLPEYNDLVKAWNYTKGEGVTVVNCENYYFGRHPDLINQWNSSFHTYIPGLPEVAFPSNTSVYSAYYHATNMAGILVAEDETTQENNLTVKSSIGVAPNAKLIGSSNYLDINNFITSHPTESVRVLSISSALGNMETTRRWFNRFTNELNMIVVGGRAYTGYYSTGPNDIYTVLPQLAQEIDGVISVGDYNPDYQAHTWYHVDETLNSNPNYYKVDINAPGWNVWTTSYTTDMSGTELEPMLTTSECTSTAVPQVAGVCVLLASLYPWMTPSEIERQIKLGGHHLDDMILTNSTSGISALAGVPNDFWGAGCLDGYGSLFLHGDFERDFTFENQPNNTALIGKDFLLSNSTIHVVNGILRVQKNAQIQLCNSQLILGDNVTVIMEQGSEINLDPTSMITVGNNVTFKSEDGENANGLFLYGNNGLTASFANSIFTNCALHTYNTTLSVEHCIFNHTILKHTSKSITVNNSIFDFSNISVMETDFSVSHYAHFSDNHITDSPLAAISITGYSSVKIRNNQILRNQGGIDLYNCLGGFIDCNDISFNNRGVYIYASNSDITGTNYITYNTDIPNRDSGFGISAQRYSNWTLTGFEEAGQTSFQTIINNQREQILFQGNSAPIHMSNNMVYSSHHNYPYIREWDDYNGISPIDIRYNYWSHDFVPERDISPLRLFRYLPTWDPGIHEDLLEDAALAIYDQAIVAETNMDYIVAEQLLKQIIAEYPETQACSDAAKELLHLVETYNQNFQALEIYYKTYPSLRDNPTICKLADYLANFCSIKMGEYEEAISFFEDIITNSSDLPDSIFAVIDAGYTYLLLSENSDKAQFTGKIAWLKPKSVDSYLESRDRLLNLISNVKEEDAVLEVPIKFGLDQNFPNPFNPSTTISYTIPEEAKVTINVYNIKGQLVRKLFANNQVKGEHKLIWNGKNDNGKQASSGLYLIKIDYQGKSITRKALMLK
jgi:tetratricopeptide (TPR) repeat protein